MLDLTRRTVAAWSVGVALLASMAGCEAVLGIRDARLDPNLSSIADDLDAAKHADGAEPTPSEADGGSTDGSDARARAPVICQPFDNAKRLKNLLPDGGLMPLPSQVSP